MNQIDNNYESNLLMAPLPVINEGEEDHEVIQPQKTEQEDEGEENVEEDPYEGKDPILYKYVKVFNEEFLKEEIEHRINMGQGEALIDIGMNHEDKPVGLPENEYKDSVRNLRLITERMGVSCASMFKKRIGKPPKYFGEFMVRRIHQKSKIDYVDVRIAIVGNVDSGKSTLIGVMTKGALDNGRGKARENVFNYKHELDSGRTSSVSLQILGFNSNSKIVNYLIPRATWPQICEQSSKMITFVDLCGHEKYLKTTMYGCTAAVPDYACVVIGSNMGVQMMTKEHIGILGALKLPFFVVITKIDLCPANVLKNTIQAMKKVLKGMKKTPFFVKKTSDVVSCVKHLGSERVAPIFLISNVTGEGLARLKKFLNMMPKRKDFRGALDKNSEFFVDGIFYVTGVGTVVSGVVNQGKIRVNEPMFIGPDGNGAFRKTLVKGIHCKRVPVEEVVAGTVCTLALKKEKRNHIRKGMVLVGQKKDAISYWNFTSEILVLYHATTIKKNYQPVIHTENIRQSARIISMDRSSIRSGDKAIVRFRWISRPEYVKIGATLIFREGRTKGIGKITEVF